MMSLAELQALIKAAGANMVCSGPRTPQTLLGFFLEATRRLYADKRNLMNLVKPWSATNDKDGLFIVPSAEWSDKDVNRSPAIILKVGDFDFDQARLRSIGNGMHDFHGGQTRYDSISTTITWSHRTENEGQGLLYVSNTYSLLQGFSEALRREGGFRSVWLGKLKVPVLKEQAPKYYLSEIVLGVAYDEAVSTVMESPILKAVDATTVISDELPVQTM